MPSDLAAVPPAQLPSKYRDVVKIALQPRQTRAFILAAVAWHLLLTSALLKTISLSLVSPLTLATSLLSFGLGVLPLLARRKRNLSSVTAPPARLPSSKSQQVSAALSSPALLPLVSQHIVAFIALAAGYTALLTSQTGGWGPQIWVESHGSFYLNERFLYLVGQSAVLGAVYAGFFRALPSLEAVASPSFDPSALSSDVVVTIKDRVVAAFGSRLPRAAAMAALTSISSMAVYSIIRIRLWSALLLVIGTRGLMRRLLVPSFRVDFGYIEVSVRTILFSIAAVCAVETAYLLLDVYLSHPLPALSKYAKNPNRLLLDGIDEPILFFSNHAFSEVARLSANDKESRTAIYRDVNADVTAWTHIRDRCLALLDAQKRFVLRRGQMPTTTQTIAQSAAQNVVQQQQQKGSTQPAPTIWDQLAAGQTATSQNVAPTTQSSAAASTSAATTANANKAPAAAPLLSAQSITRAVISLTTLAWKFVPQDAKHVLFGPRRRQALLGDSPASEATSIIGRDAARTVGAVMTLQALLCHSLAEDPYGTVQRDIQRVLVAMVDLDTEIRRFGIELEQRAVTIDENLGKLEAEVNNSGSKEGGSRTECQGQLREAWRDSGAQNVDLSLTASIREILDTFGKFDLQLDAELEVKLADCLG
ncbi:uncharacterized protein SPSC_00594 [Sporisorium scitamineum]|uniref:Nucleoporin protein Ndc1-Nup n=1 Tax=Sporisorium scitamineum TaxID=49012 RepID=A0A0F7S953_9BASI|nr:uncharacterized protein SPSC_00594 [Sporisorium scitamineum]CDW98806.1 hypothetical protein [Sporisorium scitamineum]